MGSSATELFTKQLTPADAKRWRHGNDRKAVTRTRAPPLPCNLKVILQTIIVNFSLRVLSLVSVYDPSIKPKGQAEGEGGGGAEGAGGLALWRLSGSSMCHGKENMPPVAGLFKVSFQRLPSLFNANITGWPGPRASCKQEVSANPGLP